MKIIPIQVHPNEELLFKDFLEGREFQQRAQSRFYCWHHWVFVKEQTVRLGIDCQDISEDILQTINCGILDYFHVFNSYC